MNAEEGALRRFLHYCYRSGVPDPLRRLARRADFAEEIAKSKHQGAA